MSMPNLFSCFVCGLSIDPKSHLVIRKAVVWLKSGGQKVHEVDTELHIFRHEFCKPDKMPKEDSLF